MFLSFCPGNYIAHDFIPEIRTLIHARIYGNMMSILRNVSSLVSQVDHFDFRFSTMSLIRKKLEDDFYFVVFKVWCRFGHTPFPLLHFLFSLHVVFVFFSFGFYVFSCLFLINRYASVIVILAFI